MLSFLPWTYISPPSLGSAPKIARAVSVRPAPTSPATPRISPLRTLKDTFCTMRPAQMFLTSRAMGASAGTLRSLRVMKISRPTIMEMIFEVSTSWVLTVAT